MSLSSLGELGRALSNLRSRDADVEPDLDLPQANPGLSMMLNGLDWEHLREEVDRECRTKILLAGPPRSGKSTLLNRLKGLSGTTEAGGTATFLEDHGLFTIVSISDDSSEEVGDCLWDAVQNADLVLWVLDGVTGLHPGEEEHICRVRATGKPLLVVMNKLDQVATPHASRHWRAVLACPVIPISAREGTNIDTQLIPRMLDINPGLATCLGRDLLGSRRLAAQRVAQQAALLSGLVSNEPAPLLDIPMQLMVQLRMVLRLAAIFGEPVGSRYSRELIATLVGSLGVRYLGQTAAKLVPIAGSVVASAVAASGTWALARVATAYFENQRRLPLPTGQLAQLPVIRLWRPRHGGYTDEHDGQH